MVNQSSLSVARVLAVIRRSPSFGIAVVLGVVMATTLVSAADSDSDSASPQATTNLSELMTRIVQPSSDAVFYVARTPPQTGEDWRRLESQTLMLAESANLLLIPGYVQAQEQWVRDSLLMRNAAVAAYKAAQTKDLAALEELNNALYESCENCHMATR
jgi:hypothetical protein